MKVSGHRRGQPEGARRTRRRFGFLRVRDWRVPTKLTAVLLIPAVAFLVIGGLQINSSVRDATELGEFAEGVTVGRELTVLVHDLQTERDRTAGVMARIAAGTLSDQTSVEAELGGDYAAVDAALAAFTEAAQPLQSNRIFRNASSPLAEDFRQLVLTREGVKGRWVRQEAVFEQYNTVIGHLFSLVPARSDVGGDLIASRNISSLLEFAEAKELVSELRGRIFAACTAGAFQPTDFETFAAVQARFDAAIERFRAQGSPRHLAAYDRAIRGTEVASVTRMQKLILERARGGVPGVSPTDWWSAATAQLDFLRVVERDILQDAIDGAADRASAERRKAFLATTVIVLIMVAALLLSWLIGRSMARSLRALRAQALDVAQQRLPEAIQRLRTTPRTEQLTIDVTSRVRSADEIGEVAEAFTAVHRSAVTLAVEQAVMRRNVNAMFVNLARRSQTLVERQLQLLDTLEAAETDPDQLGNLFKLDHLATRMRRNDENLLVLAGSEVGRRWAEPVALSAVALAAMAEIEQYARIRHDIAAGVYVVGHAVSDIVHLLAELLENATTFSPPDSVVTVSGWLDRHTGEATLVIEDHGIGMSETGFAEANERVNGPLAIDVAASERMGLVVVGHLAARHSVRIRLRGSTEGVVAQVVLPTGLLAEPPESEAAYAVSTGRLTTVMRPSVAAVQAADARAAAPTSAPADLEATTEIPVPVAVPGPGRPTSTGVDNGAATAHREAPPAAPDDNHRRLPKRAEDVLDPGRAQTPVGPGGNGKGNGVGTRWWTRGGGPAPADRGPAIPSQRPPSEPVIAGTSNAGLPMRRPPARSPVDDEVTQPLPTRPEPIRTDPEPERVSSMLARFYSGVHRAANEEEMAARLNAEHRGSKA